VQRPEQSGTLQAILAPKRTAEWAHGGIVRLGAGVHSFDGKTGLELRRIVGDVPDLSTGQIVLVPLAR